MAYLLDTGRMVPEPTVDVVLQKSQQLLALRLRVERFSEGVESERMAQFGMPGCSHLLRIRFPAQPMNVASGTTGGEMYVQSFKT